MRGSSQILQPLKFGNENSVAYVPAYGVFLYNTTKIVPAPCQVKKSWLFWSMYKKVNTNLAEFVCWFVPSFWELLPPHLNDPDKRATEGSLELS